MDFKEKRLLILGARGLVGSSLVRYFRDQGYKNILAPFRDTLNLKNGVDCLNYFKANKPDWVIMAAAKVGGIYANNTYRADFILENLQIQNNVFEAALQERVEKFLFLGSSCIYPKNCPQPIREEYLLTGPLEPTNEPYAIAKIAGLKTAESIRKQHGLNFFSAMPTNLYGINDNFHPQNSHVIPGLIARMQETINTNKPEFRVWGSGRPRREFLYVDDLAEACAFLVEYPGNLPDVINIGTGTDISIRDLAHLVQREMNFKGQIVFDTNMPDGMLEKRLDVSLIKSLGWKSKTSLEEGLRQTIAYYRNRK